MTSPKTTTKTKSKAKRRTQVDDLAVITVSPSLEVLEGLDIHNTLASVEARLDSMEIDIARQAGSADDESRRFTGELAVMKARVQDAIDAFSQTADEVRAMVKSVDARLEAPAAKDDSAAAIRAELEARIHGATAGIGDALEGFVGDVTRRIDDLGETVAQVQDALGGIADALVGLATVPERLEALEATVARGEA